MKYSFLKSQRYSDGLYEVEPYREQDLFQIMQWRNEQMDVLRQKEIISPSAQENYYNRVIEKSFQEQQTSLILFSYLYDKECIGYGGLTNVDWENKRTELSFLLSTSRASDKEQYSKDFGIFIRLMKTIAFDDLNFHRIFTETYDIRPLHISILEKEGFMFEGRMRDHVLINEKFVDSLLHGIIKSKIQDAR